MKTFGGRSPEIPQSQYVSHDPSGEKLLGMPSAILAGEPAALGGAPPSSRRVMTASFGGPSKRRARRPSRLQSCTNTREPEATVIFSALPDPLVRIHPS